jgi:hypothetical protein
MFLLFNGSFCRFVRIIRITITAISIAKSKPTTGPTNVAMFDSADGLIASVTGLSDGSRRLKNRKSNRMHYICWIWFIKRLNRTSEIWKSKPDFSVQSSKMCLQNFDWPCNIQSEVMKLKYSNLLLQSFSEYYELYAETELC